ncbi:MAG: 4-diphosphocytidyl-2C-methyl-D-erythritol kinase [Bacteroidota bacterium]
MKFGEVRVDDAVGLILAHSLRLPQAMLKKGRVLTAEDVRLLKGAGVNFLTGARLEGDDVGEDEAAGTIARALAGDGITINAPFTGRCNLFAARRGLLVYDRERLDRLNLVDEAVTVATAPAFELVGPRRMVATVKIIPFGVDRRVLDACAAYASTGGPLISVRPFRPRRAVLISTTLPGLRESVMAVTAAVTRGRIEALGGEIIAELRCPHEIGPIERTLGKALGLGADLILVAGASATVDRRDVVPSAIERAGGAIDHFGMPADPGNLLLLAHLGAVPVVNLPGCARSAKPNGLDWVLARIAADIPIKPADMMRMGAGGLLKQLGVRPRDTAWMEPPTRDARIGALVQADGAAAPMAEVEAALAAGLDPVLVLASSDEMADILPSCEVICVENRAPAAGLALLPADVAAVLVLPAGCPDVSPEAVADLAKAFDPDEGRAIVLPGGVTNWGIVSRELFAQLGEHSLPELAAKHPEAVFEVVLS